MPESAVRRCPLSNEEKRLGWCAAGQHEQQAPQQQAQPMAAGTESAAATERQQQSGVSAGAGSNGATNGQVGANGAQSANGAPASAGLPIAPLRLDSGLQVCFCVTSFLHTRLEDAVKKLCMSHDAYLPRVGCV